MRNDIEAALNNLSDQARTAIVGQPGLRNGILGNPKSRRALAQLEAFAADQRVLAVARRSAPNDSMATGPTLSKLAAKVAQHLIVVTDSHLHEHWGTGVLNGNETRALSISLPDITDVRVNTNRSVATALRKDRCITFDYSRGRDIETCRLDIPTDSELNSVWNALTHQLAIVGARMPLKTDSGEPNNSVADELSKLVDLRDAGALSDDEFASQKAKLLAR